MRNWYQRNRPALGVDTRPTRVNFIKNLVQLMKEKELNGSDLALLVGRTPTTISRWKQGKKEPNFQDIDAIAKALGVTVGRLFEDPTEPGDLDPKRVLRLLEAAIDTADKNNKSNKKPR